MSLLIDSAIAIGRTAPAPVAAAQNRAEKEPLAGGSFSRLLESAGRAINGSGVGLHAEIAAFEDGVRNGVSFSARELILYQIKAGRFGLGVEMLSRLAEGLMGTIRRFQQGQ